MPRKRQMIQKFADKGSESFDKLNASANKAADGVASASEEMGQSAQSAIGHFDKLGNVKFSPGIVAGLNDLEEGMKRITSNIKPAIESMAKFVTRVTALGVAVGATAVAFGDAARKIAIGQQDQGSATQENTATLVKANNELANSDVATINLASSQRQLLKQLQTGKITYAQYGQAIQDSNDQFAEQQRVAAEVANAQDRAREANERLQKSMKDREATGKLIDQFGGPLLTSLTAVGNQVEAVRKDFVNSFGPGAAAAVDLVSETLSKNGGAISTFFDQASSKIDKLIKENGPAIQKVLEELGKAAASVFDGFLSVLPSVIDFFLNKFVPAVKSTIEVVKSLTEFINGIFGTNFTVSGLAAVAIILQLTGGFKVLMVASRILVGGIQVLIGAFRILWIAAGGPLAIAITALTIALIYLATQVDWTAFAKNAKTAVANVVSYFSALPGRISAFFSAMWESVKSLAGEAVDWIVQKWNDFVTFIQNLPTSIPAAFASLWETVKTFAGDAVDWIQQKWNDFITWIQDLPTRVGSFFSTLWENAKTLAGDAVDWIQQKWNDFVTFLQGLPDSISAVWTQITDGVKKLWEDTINTIKGWMQAWVDWISEKFGPILTMLKLVAQLASSQADAGAAAGAAMASGGRVRGPGGPTSDSIPAWLSNGEYVIRARSVAKYGTALMHAINSGRFSPSAFAFGGFVAPPPSRSNFFADGGPVTANVGGRTINLTIGGETFAGLIAPEDVADRLSKFATIRQVRSAGRKPSWVGGRK